VDVRSLSLPEALRGGESVESVWVEVELLELDPGAARLKTGAVQCRGGQCDVNFSHSLPLTDGSAAAESLGKALRSEDEQDSDVYFVLKGRGAAGSVEKELGQAYVNLEQMLREGRDLERAVLPLEMNSPAGAGASLTVSLVAVDALRKLRAKVKQAARPKGASASAGAATARQPTAPPQPTVPAAGAAPASSVSAFLAAPAAATAATTAAVPAATPVAPKQSSAAAFLANSG